MKSKTSRWISGLATMLLLLNIPTMVVYMWLGLRNPVEPYSIEDIVFAFLLSAFPIVGWLIAVKRPQNPLGWVYLALPLLIGIGAISQEIALRAAQPHADDTAAILLIIGGWSATIGYWLPAGPGLLLFPNGHVISKRWGWVLWGSATLLLIFGVTFAVGAKTVCLERFSEASDPCTRWLENPLGLISGARVSEVSKTLIMIVIALTLGVSLISVVIRYIHSNGEVRQQIKWVAWMATMGLLTSTVSIVGGNVLGLIPVIWGDMIWVIMIYLGLPVAIGVAIFKYQLYEIDRIISQTAAYTLVVGILSAVYLAVVTLIQRILPVESQFGIIVSTLVVAALFTPLRRRIQKDIDRRFYRRKYDARQTMEAFAVSLRQEVDLDEISQSLLAVTMETMQPEGMSLWLAEEPIANTATKNSSLS